MKCPHCKEEGRYSEGYDVVFCETCDIWLESACSDENCEFCRDRSERPSQSVLKKKHQRLQFSMMISDADAEMFQSMVDMMADECGFKMIAYHTAEVKEK